MNHMKDTALAWVAYLLLLFNCVLWMHVIAVYLVQAGEGEDHANTQANEILRAAVESSDRDYLLGLSWVYRQQGLQDSGRPEELAFWCEAPGDQQGETTRKDEAARVRGTYACL